MESQVHNLRDLMTLDQEYFRLKTRLREIPRELEQVEQQASALRRALLTEEARLTQAQRERKQLETQIQDKQEAKLRFERQLYEVRENRELQSLQREIEFLRQGMSEMETRTVELLEQEEALEKELQKLRDDTKKKDRDLEVKRERLAVERSECQATVDSMEGDRKRLMETLRPPTRSKYKRLVDAKGQEAIVALVDGSCGGCFYKLPPQTAAEVRMGQQLIVCEACGRILVWHDD